MSTQKFRNVLLGWLLILVCLMPVSALAQVGPTAQGSHTETFGMAVDDAQIEAWLGRERSLNHPLVDGLEAQDAATLHFYFSREYAQRAKSVIASAEQAREKTLRFLPKETVENIHVYLLGNINTYFEAQNSRGRAPEWAAGLTILHDGVILIRLAPNGATRMEPERTLAHELNHAALRRFSQDNTFPHWFYEGLAMLATEDWGAQRAEVLGRASMAGQLLALDEIDAAFGKTGALVDLAYSQSAHFVSWIATLKGDEGVRTLIREVAMGKPFDDAFFDVYERSPKAAFAIWYDRMSREKSLLASIFSRDGLFFFISLFAAFGLIIALWRKSVVRKRRKANMNQAVPVTALPENLRNFGPFTMYMK